jgi:hypothetical protein
MNTQRVQQSSNRLAKRAALALTLACGTAIGASGVAAAGPVYAPVNTAASRVAASDLGAPTNQSDAELSMIQLQSVVSQRKHAVQLTTSMLEAMNESLNDVARNIDGGSTPAPAKEPVDNAVANEEVDPIPSAPEADSDGAATVADEADVIAVPEQQPEPGVDDAPVDENREAPADAEPLNP